MCHNMLKRQLLHTRVRHVNTIIPSICLNLYLERDRMTHHALGKSTITFFTIFLSFSALACYRTPQQLCRKANKITKHQSYQRELQHSLVDAFKHSTAQPFKQGHLHSIVAAVAHKNPFTQLEKKKSILTKAIDEFNRTPGFLSVLSRALDGAKLRNISHFVGAVAELEAALEQKGQQKTIISFNVAGADGQSTTEFDFISKDRNGKITCHEIKSRRNEPDQDDQERIDIQNKKQREIAYKAGFKHKLEIRYS